MPQHVRYEPIKLPLITSEVASLIVKSSTRGLSRARVSLNLCISVSECVIEGGLVRMDGEEIEVDALKEIIDDERSIYVIKDSKLRPAEIRSRHFYKLVKTRWGHAPTLEIDGIHMHRVSGIAPEEDAMAKVRLIRRIRSSHVLDTCMGLGYTSLAALKMGAKLVVTVEKDSNVYELARLNPWSHGLVDSRIKTVRGDVLDYVFEVRDSSFDVVIHDPPRLALAGELYSSSFYSELNRVLRAKGELVHYVGTPGLRGGKRIYVGVMRRLREAGFIATWFERLGVVYAYKA